MKKLATVMIASVFLLICGCGPSAKEKEAKRIADSIAYQDSINKHLIKVHLKKNGTPDLRYKENKKHKK